jgi:hypothetical protein
VRSYYVHDDNSKLGLMANLIAAVGIRKEKRPRDTYNLVIARRNAGSSVV